MSPALGFQAQENVQFRQHTHLSSEIPTFLRGISSAQAINGEVAKLLDADKENVTIIVLDGCSDCCSCKKLQKPGIEPDIHICASNLELKNDEQKIHSSLRLILLTENEKDVLMWFEKTDDVLR